LGDRARLEASGTNPRTHPYRTRGLLVLTPFRRAGNLFLRVWDTQALRVLVTMLVTCRVAALAANFTKASSAGGNGGGLQRATRPTAG
jgi:hypothetical protein